MCLLEDLPLGCPFVHEGRVFYRGHMRFLRNSDKPKIVCFEVVNRLLSFVEYCLPCDTIVKLYEFPKKE